MTAADWIAKRREIEQAATEGPWKYLSRNVIETPVIDVSEANWGGEGLHGYHLVACQDSGAWRNEDAAFIADARNSLPRALDALEAAEAVPASDIFTGDEAHDLAYAQGWYDALSAVSAAITEALGVTP